MQPILCNFSKKYLIYLVEVHFNFCKNLVKNRHEMIDVFNGEDHRWFQFQNVVIGTVAANENPVVLHSGHNVLRLRRRWYLVDSIANQFDTDKQTDAANITDNSPSFRQFFQLRQQMTTDFQGVLL